MDKNKALHILGLGPDATREEAKKAFRSLAKSWHPDRFAGDSDGERTAEVRMKDVNGAFYFLLPLLRAAPESVPTQEAQVAKGPGFFSSVRERWNNRYRSNLGPSSSVSKNRSPGSKGPEAMKPEVRHAQSPRFETLLNTLEPELKISPGKPSKSGTPYENYCRYISVKKKIKGVRRRSKHMGMGRVEKISRVSRVTPIGER